MDTGRLEAFSNGVIAILITIMMLELKIPRGAGLEALRPLLPIFLTYILSFVFLGIYWNNHHHSYTILQTVIVAQEGEDSVLAQAVGKDKKGKLSMLLYGVAIPSAFIHQWISDAIYVFVALVWLVPDRRIESKLSE